MGEVVSLNDARAARQLREQQEVHAEIRAAIARGEGCPWSEEELVEDWSRHVKRSWRPRRGIKRGCIKRVMRTAYREGDQGTDWIKVCPLDLILVALPREYGEDNVEAATYLTMLLFDYLWRIAAISGEDKAFAFEWSRKSEAHLLSIAGADPGPELPAAGGRAAR